MLKTLNPLPVPDSTGPGCKHSHHVAHHFVCKRKAGIEDIPHDELVDSLARHLRMVDVGRVGKVCTRLHSATARHVVLPARAWKALCWWRQTARATRTAWQTVMFWRLKASRLAEDSYTDSIMEELEEIMSQSNHSEVDLTDEEVDFLEHHMMKHTWEGLCDRIVDAALVPARISSILSVSNSQGLSKA